MPTPRHCDKELKFKNQLLLMKLLPAKQHHHRQLLENKHFQQV
jgi:hypothetical protein